MSLPRPHQLSGGPAGIETSSRRRQNPNQPPNLTTSLGNARHAGLGVGGVVQTPISSTTLSSPFSTYPHSSCPQSPAGVMRGASPMASRSASGFSGHYNPQQWGAVNNVSPNSMSIAGEHRQINQPSRPARLAPRLVGPDEPVASPPPPYSPRRDQQIQDSPCRTSDIISPADTTSPDTEYSHYGTPVSAATTLSPDLNSRFPGNQSPLVRQHKFPNKSPNAGSPPSFPPPPGPGQRIRAGSKIHADRLLSSLTLRGKSSKVFMASNAVDTLQDHTAQTLNQASSAHFNDPMVHPPAARRAASTGGIGLTGGPSRSTSSAPSPVTWEADMPLPPPPPGPPPASARSQSLNRPMESPSSGFAPTLPLRSRRLPGTGTSLDTVPPTPADWREEDTNHQPLSHDRSHGPSPLHIDTGSILRKRGIGADYPTTATTGGSAHSRRDSSSGGLFRSPAVRNCSAMGIRERRSESRNGKGRAVEYSAVEPSSSVTRWADEFEDVRPTNLILSASHMHASKQGIIAKSTPKSDKSMQNSSPEPQKSSGKAVSFASSYTTPQPGSSQSEPFSANLTSPLCLSPSKETLDHSNSAVASPSSPLKMFSIPPPKVLSAPPSAPPRLLSVIVPPGPEQRPMSHLLHDDSVQVENSMQIPLTPSTKAAQELPEDLLGPESPKLFARRAIERHQIFAKREAAAANDSERLELFVQYMKAESRIRREQYTSVFEDDGIDVDELTQGLFGHSNTGSPSHVPQLDLLTQDSSKRTSIASSALEDSSQGDSSAVSRKHESPSSVTTNSSTQQRPESTYWKDYVPSLSPIASMSIVTGQDDLDSRGRAPSRWFEEQSHSGDGPPGDAFRVLERSKREIKYMGVTRHAPILFGNIASASTGGGQWQPSEARRQPVYDPNQYPLEKIGLREDSSIPPPSFLPPTPLSAPLTPDPRRLDVSRLVTLPPPFPRHHPAVNNNHPDLVEVRAVVRLLHEKEEAETITDSYRTAIHEKRQRADSWCKHQRSLHSKHIRIRIEHDDISQEDIDVAEVELEKKIANSEKEIAQTDFDLYQEVVLTPLHALFSDRIKQADASLDKLSSRLFSDAQSQSPNPQEEGDEQPELLEKLTQLKWLFEARETLHRQIYNLLSERNDRYKTIVLLPYQRSQNQEKHAEAEIFFAKDAQERRFKFQQAVDKRAQAFLSVVENNVSRGVEVQLSAFWDIAPSLLEVLHKLPSQLNGFEIQIPGDEYAENPSYYDHPLQYLYLLLGHAEKSTYQFIESQINLLCLLHEIRSHALAARCTAEAKGRDPSWAAEEEQREGARLTEDLKEKVGVVEGQWEEALGREILEVRERVREALLEGGGWDDEGDEV